MLAQLHTPRSTAAAFSVVNHSRITNCFFSLRLSCRCNPESSRSRSSSSSTGSSSAGSLAFWSCTHSWRRSGVNTLWCLAGCSIGEFGVLGTYSLLGVDPLLPVPSLPLLAAPLLAGLATSVALETAILVRGTPPLPVQTALETALGMSFISMLAMELAMEATDYALTGSMALQLWAMPWMLAAGFLTPLPFNYWRLRAHGKACH